MALAFVNVSMMMGLGLSKNVLLDKKMIEPEYLHWNKVQRSATMIGIIEGDQAAAIAVIEEFLDSEPRTDIRREAIAFRGTLYRDQGELLPARDDFQQALALADEGFTRFELQNTLAEICKQIGDRAQAEAWYMKALETGAQDSRVAGGGFLARFLDFRGANGLTDRERKLAEIIVHQSWDLLQVEGHPPTSLMAAAALLMAAQQKIGRRPDLGQDSSE